MANTEKLSRGVFRITKRANGTKRVQTVLPKGSRTKQSFVAECDINTIMRKYRTTGALPNMIKGNPQYGDFSTVTDYQDAYNTVLKTREQFDNLPSHTRERFMNSPEEFLKFCDDPKNAAEMVKMGLAVAREPSPATPTPTEQPKTPEAGK
ncbi:MAG: internal scaffolding protein [Arizlama microvirus]|nr:MAG: internal scaffolding protein [Arizlama microvirus]